MAIGVDSISNKCSCFGLDEASGTVVFENQNEGFCKHDAAFGRASDLLPILIIYRLHQLFHSSSFNSSWSSLMRYNVEPGKPTNPSIISPRPGRPSGGRGWPTITLARLSLHNCLRQISQSNGWSLSSCSFSRSTCSNFWGSFFLHWSSSSFAAVITQGIVATASIAVCRSWHQHVVRMSPGNEHQARDTTDVSRM